MIYSFALILLIIAQLVFFWVYEDKNKKITLTTDSWMLEKITTGKVSEDIIEKPKNYNLEFNNKGNFKMLSDCNKCSGNYTTASKFIKFEEIECTKKMCGKKSYDYVYRKNIEMASSFKIYDNRLILKNYKGKMYFSLK